MTANNSLPYKQARYNSCRLNCLLKPFSVENRAKTQQQQLTIAYNSLQTNYNSCRPHSVSLKPLSLKKLRFTQWSIRFRSYNWQLGQFQISNWKIVKPDLANLICWWLGANLKLLQNDYVTNWCRPLSSCANSIGQCPHSRGNPLPEEVAVGESWSEHGLGQEGSRDKE